MKINRQVQFLNALVTLSMCFNFHLTLSARIGVVLMILIIETRVKNHRHKTLQLLSVTVSAGALSSAAPSGVGV